MKRLSVEEAGEIITGALVKVGFSKDKGGFKCGGSISFKANGHRKNVMFFPVGQSGYDRSGRIDWCCCGGEKDIENYINVSTREALDEDLRKIVGAVTSGNKHD